MVKCLGNITAVTKSSHKSKQGIFVYYDFSSESFFFDRQDLGNIIEDMDILPNKVERKISSFEFKLRTCGIPVQTEYGVNTVYKCISLGSYLDNAVNVYFGVDEDAETDENLRYVLLVCGNVKDDKEFVLYQPDTIFSLSDLGDDKLEFTKYTDFHYRTYITKEIAYVLSTDAEFRKAIVEMIYVKMCSSNCVSQLG